MAMGTLEKNEAREGDGSADEGVCRVLNRMVEKGLSEKMAFLQKTEPSRYLGKSISDRGSSRCKGPEVGAMPGMFEEWQDDHCGYRGEADGKPEGMRPDGTQTAPCPPLRAKAGVSATC